MLKSIQRGLSYANVVSSLCLFLLLGGGTFAIASSDSKKDNKVANNVVTERAPRLAVASATNATNATNASNATNLAAPEPFHEVGAPGEPGFQNSWHNTGGSDETTGFYKDREGVVHLKGRVFGGATNTTIFQLPAGYRPATGKALTLAAACGCSATDPQGGTVSLDIGDVGILGPGVSAGMDGAVILSSTGTSVFLDGISFRAAP